MGRLTQAEAAAFKAAVQKSTTEAAQAGTPRQQADALYAALTAECGIVALVLAKAHADTLVAEATARLERHAEHLRRLETRVAALERDR